MSADPDDSFTLDMIDSAEPRVEMSDAEKAKARNGGAYRSRLASLGFLAPSAKPRAWRREPVLISPRAPPRPRDSTKLDLPEIDLPEIDLPAIDPGGDFGRGLERIAARANL